MEQNQTQSTLIKVEFLTQDGNKTHIANFIDEDMYIECIEILESQAKKNNAILIETIEGLKPRLKWEGVDKIIHQGYWYAKYTDLQH